MEEENLPIDINTSKLLDWLISRRHVSKDWQSNIQNIREKINNAIQDMPEHGGIVNLLSGQHINYFHCIKIIEILKETEVDTKNLFGRYGSQRMKDWVEIVQCYRKDGMYLAEAAQMLIRNVNFEVPSLRKQIAKLEQTQLDYEKKIKDYNKTETVTLNEFHSSCKQLGIAGCDIKNELYVLLEDLPKIYEGIVGKIENVKSAVSFYSNFLRFHSGSLSDTKILPLLSYVLKNGNTTTYELLYDKIPASIDAPIIRKEEREKFDHGGIIIDFVDEIDFGIDEGFEIVGQMPEPEEELAKPKSEVARGNEAFSILDNPKTRNELLNDLIQLEAFLLMRCSEMSNCDTDLLSMAQMQDTLPIIEIQTVESITGMLEATQLVLNEFTNKRTQHLHNIKHSPKYIDMLTASLTQKLMVAERLRAGKGIFTAKIVEARELSSNIQPTIELVIKNTKILQREIEDDISTKYKGRPVHIVGAVNML